MNKQYSHWHICKNIFWLGLVVSCFIHFSTTLLAAWEIHEITDSTGVRYYLFPVLEMENHYDGKSFSWQPKKQSDLEIKGLKQFSIRVDNYDSEFTQTTSLSISGKLADKTIVEGRLKDNTGDFQESSAPISEWEGLFLKLKHPHYELLFGEFETNLWQQRKLRGIRAQIQWNEQQGEVLTGSVRGQRKTATWEITDVHRRSYSLFPNEKHRLSLHSEKVVHNGTTLQRNRDYMMDYETGTITFLAGHMLKIGDFLRVSALVAEQTLPRSALGTTTQLNWKQENFYWEYYQEKDDKQSLSETEKDIWATQPRNQLYFWQSGAQLVEPGQGDYVLQDSIFVFQPDSSANYLLTFRYVGDNHGDYHKIGPGIFEYVGKENGDYLPQVRKKAPQEHHFTRFFWEHEGKIVSHRFENRWYFLRENALSQTAGYDVAKDWQWTSRGDVDSWQWETHISQQDSLAALYSEQELPEPLAVWTGVSSFLAQGSMQAQYNGKQIRHSVKNHFFWLEHRQESALSQWNGQWHQHHFTHSWETEYLYWKPDFERPYQQMRLQYQNHFQGKSWDNTWTGGFRQKSENQTTNIYQLNNHIRWSFWMWNFHQKSQWYREDQQCSHQHEIGANYNGSQHQWKNLVEYAHSQDLSSYEISSSHHYDGDWKHQFQFHNTKKIGQEEIKRLIYVGTGGNADSLGQYDPQGEYQWVYEKMEQTQLQENGEISIEETFENFVWFPVYHYLFPNIKQLQWGFKSHFYAEGKQWIEYAFHNRSLLQAHKRAYFWQKAFFPQTRFFFSGEYFAEIRKKYEVRPQNAEQIHWKTWLEWESLNLATPKITFEQEQEKRLETQQKIRTWSVNFHCPLELSSWKMTPSLEKSQSTGFAKSTQAYQQDCEKANLELQWAQTHQKSLFAYMRWQHITRKGSLFESDYLSALGNSYFWGMNYRYQLSQSTSIIINYLGMSIPLRETYHSGQAQVSVRL